MLLTISCEVFNIYIYNSVHVYTHTYNLNFYDNKW